MIGGVGVKTAKKVKVLEKNQLESYNHRMLKPPFVCRVCRKKPANITTTNWRSCMKCYWKYFPRRNPIKRWRK